MEKSSSHTAKKDTWHRMRSLSTNHQEPSQKKASCKATTVRKFPTRIAKLFTELHKTWNKLLKCHQIINKSNNKKYPLLAASLSNRIITNTEHNRHSIMADADIINTKNLLNINSLISHTKRAELSLLLQKTNPHIMLLSETKLNKKHSVI